MLHRYAQNANISIDEARTKLPARTQTYGTHGTNEIVYREFVKYLDVTSEYRPRIVFFCETAQGTSTFNILNIYSVQLVRIYDNSTTGTRLTKQFNGELNAWLRSVWKIEYYINGDFFNFGTTTTTGGGEVHGQLNEKIALGFSVSRSETSNYYASIYEHDNIQCFH